MLIQLKQKQIEAALRGYIIKMGIDLKGRTLDISFVSGRKDNGLTADINFEDFPMEDDELSPGIDAVAPLPPKEVPVKRAAVPEEPVTAAEPEAPKPAVKASVFFPSASVQEPDTNPSMEVSSTEAKAVVSLFN